MRAPEEHGTPWKEVPEVSEAETSTGGTSVKEVAAFGTPRKKAKKKGVSKATEEGESSVQTTSTKEQTEVEETEMDTQDIDIDIENTQSPEKSDAKKAKRLKKRRRLCKGSSKYRWWNKLRTVKRRVDINYICCLKAYFIEGPV